jgi:hypothetical protein
VGINEDGSFGVSELTVLWNRMPRLLTDRICRVRVRDHETGRILLDGKAEGHCTPAEIFEEIEDGWLRAESHTVYTDVNTILFTFSLQNVGTGPHHLAPVLSGHIRASETEGVGMIQKYRQQIEEVLRSDPKVREPAWPPIPASPVVRHVRSAEYVAENNLLKVHSVEPPTDDRDLISFDLDYVIRPSFPIERAVIGPGLSSDEATQGESKERYEGEGELAYRLFGERLVLGPNEKKNFSIGLSFSLNDADFPMEKARWFGQLASPMDEVEKARRRWVEVFSRIPPIETADPKVKQAYAQAVYTLYFCLAAPSKAFSWMNKHHSCFVNKLEKPAGWYLTTPNVLPAFGEFDPDMAREVAFSFVDTQLPDGGMGGIMFSGREFTERLQREAFHPLAEAIGSPPAPEQHIVLSESPTLFWGCWRLYERTRDTEFIGSIYPALTRNMQWWYDACYIEKDGLFRIIEGSSPDWARPGEQPYRMYFLRVNSYILVSLKCLRNMAGELGLGEEAADWGQKADDLAEAIVRRMYSPEDNLFYNIFMDTYSFDKHLDVFNFTPLWGGVPLEADKAQRMLRDYLLNPRYFFGEVPFPHLAYTDPFYDPVGHWHGPFHLFVGRTLLETLWMWGLEEEADEAASKVVGVMSKHPAMYGEYDSQTGEGIRQPNCSWASATFIAALLGRYKVSKL